MSDGAEWTRDALAAAGFTGWHRFGELREHLRLVNQLAGGVYLVCRDSLEPPRWLDRNPGGTWHGDRTVSRQDLIANWVEGANVLYITAASHGRLRQQLLAFCSFGEGGSGRHFSGRLIWQLTDSTELLVAWWPIRDLNVDPGENALQMIRRFRAAYGKPPFANDPIARSG